MTYENWTATLRRMFPQRDEYDLAAKIYDFRADFINGFSPKQSYDSFDLFVGAYA